MKKIGFEEYFSYSAFADKIRFICCNPFRHIDSQNLHELQIALKCFSKQRSRYRKYVPALLSLSAKLSRWIPRMDQWNTYGRRLQYPRLAFHGNVSATIP